MVKPEKAVNRLVSLFIYTILSFMVIAAGLKAIHSASGLHVYTHYLLKWKIAITRMSASDIQFPQFSGKNHIQYMNALVKTMQKASIRIPGSNTRYPYIYQIHEKNYSISNDIFLLCFEKKIIIYGLSKTVFNMLDKQIDGNLNKNTGNFTGRLQKDNEHYTGIWKL